MPITSHHQQKLNSLSKFPRSILSSIPAWVRKSLDSRLDRKPHIPLCTKILSSNEFLYLNIRHSSAPSVLFASNALNLALYALTFSSNSLIYSILLSRNAACASRFRCLRASSVYICHRHIIRPRYENFEEAIGTYSFSPSPPLRRFLIRPRRLYTDLRATPHHHVQSPSIQFFYLHNLKNPKRN